MLKLSRRRIAGFVPIVPLRSLDGDHPWGAESHCYSHTDVNGAMRIAAGGRGTSRSKNPAAQSTT
jgi:hypothetical protein